MSNIKKKSGLKTGQLIALIVIAVLNILWIVCNLILFTASYASKICIPIAMFVIAVVYVLYGYKKPHGNHMRYLLLIYVVYEGIVFIRSIPLQPTYLMIVYLAIIVLSTYMAGRLDRYKQNLVISIIVLILQAVNTSYFVDLAIKNNSLSFATFFSFIGSVTIWLTIAAGYIIRFKPHKEAGLADKN